MVTWIPRKYIQPVAIPMPENKLDPNGIMPSSAWEIPAHTPSPAVNKQPVQQAPVVQMPVASMPKTMGRGFGSVRPRWMTLRDAPMIPSLPPASSATPCVPQPGAVGSLSSRPSPFAQQPMETHVFQPSPSGFSLEYQGSLPDDIGERSPRHRLPRQHRIIPGECRQAQLPRLPQHQLHLWCLSCKCAACREHLRRPCLTMTTPTMPACSSRMESEPRLLSDA